MSKTCVIKHAFVEYMPDVLDAGTLYISIDLATVAHKCCCGCGSEVVTPLSPTDWALTYDGKTVSLHPSIGNWGLPCQSHYWIRNNQVHWAPRWSKEEIAEGRKAGQLAKQQYYEDEAGLATDSKPSPKTRWQRFRERWW